MAREFDPNNLTAGDILKAVAPILAAFVAIYLVNRFIPDFVGLAVVALIVLVVLGILSMPKKDLEAMAEADQKLDEKIRSVPVVGPGLRFLRRVFDWLSAIVAVIIFIWFVYWAVGKAF